MFGNRMFLLLAAATLVLAGCAPTVTSPAPPTATPRLRALPSGTPAPVVPSGTPGVAPTPVIIASPTATATPVTKAVVEGESLLGIAIDYGVSLEALEAANPDVQ